MNTVETVDALRAQVRDWRRSGLRVGLVPTMGNLHRGHLRLVEALRPHVDRIVVSVFVNPTQFGAGEDFEAYPRTLEADLAQLEPLHVDIVFAPGLLEVYPEGPALRTRVEVPDLSGELCGAARPGHFAGVATVVTKLFNMVQPDVAVFGKKDYQQLLVIKTMARDLNVPVEILAVETVRESSGLAMSSRNGYLTAAERTHAAVVYATLRASAERLQQGESVAAVEQWGESQLREQGLAPDYFAVRRQADLAAPVAGDTALVVLVGARLGRARLIDNIDFELNRPL